MDNAIKVLCSFIGNGNSRGDKFGQAMNSIFTVIALANELLYNFSSIIITGNFLDS